MYSHIAYLNVIIAHVKNFPMTLLRFGIEWKERLVFCEVLITIC